MSGFLVHSLLQFGHVLRRGGLEVHPGRVRDAVRALEWVGLRRRDDVQASLRTLLVHRREDLAFFDQAFEQFWKARSHSGGGLPLFSLGERQRVVVTRGADAHVDFDVDDGEADSSATPRIAAGAWSAVDVSRTKDFEEFTAGEMARAEALMARLGWQLGVRRTRRWTRASHGAIDLRPIVRRNMKHGGELLHVPRRARREKPRPIVVLADVSGSMERYTRLLLQFVFGVTRGPHPVESFVFATRLTRITRQAMRRGPSAALRASSDTALGAVSRAVQDWGGGTRMGDALRAFNLHWARRVMRNGPIVLIVSDGWDRGDPDLLARELARIRRMSRRLVWLNPLLGKASYEPLTRGMQAALPLVDDFLPVHNLDSLENLARHLRTLDGSSRL